MIVRVCLVWRLYREARRFGGGWFVEFSRLRLICFLGLTIYRGVFRFCPPPPPHFNPYLP